MPERISASRLIPWTYQHTSQSEGAFVTNSRNRIERAAERHTVGRAATLPAGTWRDQADDMIRAMPVSSALTTFAVGLGVGLCVTLLLVSAPRPRWQDRMMPEWLPRSWSGR